MASPAQRFRKFWRSFRRGDGLRPTHHGDDLARASKHAATVTRVGGSGSSKVDEHVAKGASDYTKSFDKKR